jgi:hypothetical protein
MFVEPGRSRRTGARSAAGSAWLATFLFLAAWPTPYAATAEEGSLESLRAEIRQLQSSYETRIAALEARLAALERGAVSTGEDELSTLREAARHAGHVHEGEPVSPATPETPPPAIAGHERNLNRLNPEISFTGDVLSFTESGDQDFDPREFELDFQATLDPFSSTKWTLAYEEEEVEIEEGYVSYAGLGAGLSLRGGKMRQTFGALNRWHLHALPQPDYPLALQTFFDEEGLAQTGASVEWLLPRSWASANELTVQITDGSSEAFGGDSLNRLSALAHLKNYWDISPSTYLEWGLSGIHGSSAERRQAQVWGTDLTYHWQPPERAKYREITWRTEALLSARDDPGGARREAWGGYSYLEGLLRRNLYAGLRYDRAEDPLSPNTKRWSVEPYATWWQSEYVRLRAAYRILRDPSLRETDHAFFVQLTWAAGPHKHENY